MTNQESKNEEPLGRMARRIFIAQRRSRYRQIHTNPTKNFWVRFQLIDNIGKLRVHGMRHGGLVTKQRGISALRQFAALLKLVFVYRVDPYVYYGLHLYEAPGLSEVEYYLARFETKHGLYSLLREFRRDQPGFKLSLSHKGAFAAACHKAGLSVVPAVAVVSNGQWKFFAWTNADALDADLFVKTVRGKGAVGATAYLLRDGVYRNKTGESFTKEALIAHLTERSGDKALLVTRRLTNHPEVADFAKESLLAFRVFTAFDAEGRIVVTHGMLRVLGKLEPDWDTREEYGSAIDVDTGRLGPLCGDRNLAPDAWWDHHPHTGALVTGRVIENWPAIAALAIRAHEVFNGWTIIGWDMGLTPEGPVVIEGNSDPDTHFLQRVHRQMIGRSCMEPLLRHHLLAAEQVLAGKATFPSAA